MLIGGKEERGQAEINVWTNATLWHRPLGDPGGTWGRGVSSDGDKAQTDTAEQDSPVQQHRSLWSEAYIGSAALKNNKFPFSYDPGV